MILLLFYRVLFLVCFLFFILSNSHCLFLFKCILWNWKVCCICFQRCFFNGRSKKKKNKNDRAPCNWEIRAQRNEVKEQQMICSILVFQLCCCSFCKQQPEAKQFRFGAIHAQCVCYFFVFLLFVAKCFRFVIDTTHIVCSMPLEAKWQFEICLILQ